MPRNLGLALALVLLLTGTTLAGTQASSVVCAEDPPVHLIALGEGDAAEMYPDFDPTISRYGITTTDRTGGTVTVRATTDDVDGNIRINGQPVIGGVRTVTGLEEGDEISVFIDDRAGRSAYALIYLPSGFPKLQRVEDLDGTPSPGMVLLTLALWTAPSDFYETAVDPNGVPVQVHTTSNSLDFKPIGGGHYSVARGTTTPGGEGYDIVELDSQFREVRRRHTVPPVTNTDSHDSVTMPDGSIYFLSYEDDVGSGRVDTIIQHVSADGTQLFTWNSRDHVDIPTETLVGSDPDYAHSNSIQVLDDGDLLVSFRHFSSVFKIARTDHDGHSAGDVIWKLGGRASDFTFTDAAGRPDGGPCAQHTAYEVAPHRILTFDNGSGFPSEPMCIDPADGSAAPVARPHTRIIEWQIDEESRTAQEAWSADVPGRFAFFAGSAQRLGTGNTVVGWASDVTTIASEVDADGDLVWDISDPATDRRPDIGGTQRYFTYRAFKAAVPDAQKPVVTVRTPAAGAVYARGTNVVPDATCTDRGGSTLRTCAVPVVDTSVVGTHEHTVTATDGAGNTTAVRTSYTVVDPGVPTASPLDPDPKSVARPDAMIRVPGSRFVGRGTTRWPARHRVLARLTDSGDPGVAVLRVRNIGADPGRFTLTRTSSSRRFRISLSGAAGIRRSPVLARGQSWSVKVTVVRTRQARPGDTRDFVLRLRSAADRSVRDAVVVRVRATR